MSQCHHLVPLPVVPGIRVFVVDDEALIALDLRERLIALGYEVCGTAVSGEAAVQRIAELQPDIVLMDIKLAGSTDGIEAAQQLREYCDVPVVFLTAYSDSQLIDRATKANCYGYLLKPLKEGQLHATLKLALARFRARRSLCSGWGAWTSDDCCTGCPSPGWTDVLS